MKKLKEEGNIAKALEYELFDAKFIPLLRERSLKILQAHPKETFLIQLNSVQTLFTQDDLLYILNHSQLLPDAVRPPIPLSLLLLQKGPSAWRDMLPYLKGQYLIPYIMRPIWAVFWALSLAGVWVLIRSADSRRYMIYFFILFIFLTVVLSLPVSATLNARYRVPFAPFYFIFVAAGIDFLIRRIFRRQVPG